MTVASAESPTDQTTTRSRLLGLLGKPWSGVAILLIFYIALIIVFHFLTPFFLTQRNMLAIGSNVAFIGLMAAAGTPLIIAGGLDLSVAAIAGLTGVTIAIIHGLGVPIWIAVFAALSVGAFIGLVNGLFATKLRLNPLIVTLGMMSIVSGAALIMTGGLTRALMVPGFNWIGQGRLPVGIAGLNIPVPIILMAITFIALAVVLAKTRFGRFVYAAGGNAEASRLIGLPVERVQIILYIVSGISGAVAGAMLAAQLGAAAPGAASTHLLTVIAAIILGGTSLYGGRGSVWGTLLAVLILGTLANGLTLMDVSSFWQDVTRGVVLMLAVSLDAIRTRALGE
ncbi:MAG: ABC transporter permease [Hyphomicrobiales bacterium]|nr:ABC transporter permease [Hyphomicrobiales bacterium]